MTVCAGARALTVLGVVMTLGLAHSSSAKPSDCTASGWCTVAQATHPDPRLAVIWGAGPAVFVGGDGVLLAFDGTRWREERLEPSRASIRDIAGSGPRDVYAVGAFHGVWRWNGRAWRREHVDFHIAENFHHLDAVIVDGPGKAVAYGQTVQDKARDPRLNLVRRDDKWSRVGETAVRPRPRPAAPEGLDALCGGRARAFVSPGWSWLGDCAGDARLYAHHDGAWRHIGDSPEPKGSVRAAFVAGPEHAFIAVDRRGERVVYHFDGRAWRDQGLDPRNRIGRFWSDGTWLYAIDRDRVLRRRLPPGTPPKARPAQPAPMYSEPPECIDGWCTVARATGRDTRLTRVWGLGADTIFAGGGRTIMRFDGQRWHEEQLDGARTIDAIGGSGPTDVYAVGRPHGVWRWDGRGWHQEHLDPTVARDSSGLPNLVVTAPGEAIAYGVANRNLVRREGTWSRAQDKALPPRPRPTAPDGIEALCDGAANTIATPESAWIGACMYDKRVFVHHEGAWRRLGEGWRQGANLSHGFATGPNELFLVYSISASRRAVMHYDGADWHWQPFGYYTRVGDFWSDGTWLYAVDRERVLRRRLGGR